MRFKVSRLVFQNRAKTEKHCVSYIEDERTADCTDKLIMAASSLFNTVNLNTSNVQNKVRFHAEKLGLRVLQGKNENGMACEDFIKNSLFINRNYF